MEITSHYLLLISLKSGKNALWKQTLNLHNFKQYLRKKNVIEIAL